MKTKIALKFERKFRLSFITRQNNDKICGRYRSRKPLIVTTNLTLDSLQNPLDTAHARIYDRLLEMCAPILFTGENFRRETAQAKLNRLKELMK